MAIYDQVGRPKLPGRHIGLFSDKVAVTADDALLEVLRISDSAPSNKPNLEGIARGG